jgi:hypothetical protein
MTYQRKKKRLALWCTAFPEMHKKLRPENSAAGGIKARSQPEAVRMAVYNGIKELFITQNPMCDCCESIYRHVTGGVCAVVQFTDQIHHTRGRDGLLLFDVRYWKAACANCHSWIHANPVAAIKLGLLSKEWNKQ